MRERFRDLDLRQTVVHADGDVASQLRDLPGCDQRADRHEAPIARRKAGPQPEIAEQNVGGVLRHARKHRAEQLTNALGAIRLGGFVEREQFW